MSSGSTGQLVTQQDPDPQTARRLLGEAREAAQQLDRWTAIERYRRAFELAPNDPEICFALAYHLDLVGEEDEAIHLYEQACAAEPVYLNAMINLAVLYEDAGRYAQAERCLKAVVETDPNHDCARLYHKDVSASRQMYYEEERSGLTQPRGSLLQTPVTDFPLSDRARNCLQKMQVRTLGDLTRISEAELESYKTFGEQTLQEIRSMLSQNGLRVGQALSQQQAAARQQVYQQLQESGAGADEDVLTKPVDELDLSVRARKALDLLNLNTIGDLVSRTEDELLGVKNFGQTSLDEIKEKLAQYGLSLRKLDGSR